MGGHYYGNFNPPPNFFDSTLIIHFNGTKWVESDVPIKGRNLQSIHGSAPDNLWASGFFGTLYHFNGLEWQQDSVPVNPPSNSFFIISNVAVVSKEQAFLIGYTHQNDLAKTTNYFFLRDRGAWVVRDSFFVQPGRIENKWGYGDLWVSPSNVLYSCGGGVHRWNGSTWERLFNHPNYLSRMAGTSDKNIFVVGHLGTVLHYNGQDWHQFNEFTNPNSVFTSVWMDGKEAFIIGHTTDFPQKTIIFHGK